MAAGVNINPAPASVSTIPSSLGSYNPTKAPYASVSTIPTNAPYGTGAPSSTVSGMPMGSGYAMPTGGNMTTPAASTMSPLAYTGGAAEVKVGAWMGLLGLIGVFAL